ncbi:hypothetical protein HRW23_35030 [Streptomyces lunaelactis]|uniref:DUF5994 family protein n=1 Tax=Streptomyces lunaelactis TaxID=1535768 RepID=UPI0015853676|nr:DUF5994 family protein [Streptomyces lunaelactis]NUK03348.1 hypothetical protein [Streptomyces lunaelactis]NUK18145.1 hypothetical protein [Streptomyces lunaelactis]NUK25433.1 hypothetical protein [Streptomyces lunaelactis]NUK53126.1 hypothetical protein [Streptomyces lunaelactis]NUK60115.1 hypothetical protein [Streptomyces lunaelactis]
MTATILYTSAVEDRTSSPPLRLMLAPAGTAPALIDGAWWPRSRDIAAELPALTAVLDPMWGRITRVTVNPTFWPVIPRKVPVHGHVVHVGWFKAEQDPHKLLLLSYTAGRWDLLVIPPETSPGTAARLMAAPTDPLRSLTASGLIEEAELYRIAAEADWDATRERVWDSEGGHGARQPTSLLPAPADIAQVPDPAEGM